MGSGKPALDAEQQRVYEQLLQTKPYKEIGPMMMTTFEKGVTQGLTRGEALGLRKGLHFSSTINSARCSGEALQRLETLPPEKLEELFPAALKATSLRDLDLEGEPA